MKRLITCVIVILALGATVAQAELWEANFTGIGEEFDSITNESAHVVGADQFRMVVDTDTQDLTFYNIGGEVCLITEIYIEGTGLSLSDGDIVSNPLFVNFVAGIPSNNQPQGTVGGMDIDFTTTLGAYADPVMDEDGVLNSDTAVLTEFGYEGAEFVTLQLGATDLLQMLKDGDVRVAIKLQSWFYEDATDAESEFFLANDGEDSFHMIPEPASLALLVGSSALIGFIRKRFIV